MAQVGVKCARGLIKHSECRACALKPDHPCAYPADVLERIREENDTEPSQSEFSPTRLLGCPRQSVLLENEDWYVDVDGRWPLLRGTIMHAGMDAVRGTESYPGAIKVIREFRFTVPIDTKHGTKSFTGKPDGIFILLMDMDSETVHVRIVDYKTKGDVDHELVAAKPEHVLQINLYAYLTVKCLPEALGKPDLKVVVDELEIFYAGFNKPRRFTSRAALTARGKRYLKPLRYDTLELQPITRYSMAAMERWIRRKVEEKLDARNVLPPILQGDAAWLCDWCPIKERCYDIG